VTEVEEIGKTLQERKKSAEPTEAEYRLAYQSVQAGQISRTEAAKEFGITSKGGIYRFSQKMAEVGLSSQPETEVTEPAITPARLTEILKNGHLTQLNPRNLLSGAEPRRYQLRRFRNQIQIKELAQSIGKIGVIEPLIIRDSPVSRLIIDGFGRADAWIMADEAAGGTTEASILEHPACLLVDCTDKEAAFIAFEKNRRRENFDEADRDHSIVVLHEQQHYTVSELADLIELDHSSISRIIHAFQDIPTKARTALEDRMITTYHATQIAKLKDWPEEQDRLTSWLIEEIGKPEFKLRKDANYDNGHSDTSGISAGRLSEMVGDVLERKKQAKAIAADLEKMKSTGKIEEAISAEKADALRSQFAKSLHISNPPTKRTMQEAMRTAGVKLAKPIEATTVETGAKPKSPARFAQDREQPKLKPCLNCQEYYENTDACLYDLKPDESNRCGVQEPGRPMRTEPHCLVCGGVVLDDLMDKLKVVYEQSIAKNGNYHNCHTMCLIDQVISSGTLDGKCRSCQSDSCQILDIMRDEADGGSKDNSLVLVVKECPTAAKYGTWFHPRPEITLDEINRQAKELLEKEKTKALKGSASGGSH
jgi:ParB-like chromosome segregation protein Spo0J